jgi:hypothetical protein
VQFLIWGIIIQGGCELCKFSKLLGVKLELECVAGEELEIALLQNGMLSSPTPWSGHKFCCSLALIQKGHMGP